MPRACQPRDPVARSLLLRGIFCARRPFRKPAALTKLQISPRPRHEDSPRFDVDVRPGRQVRVHTPSPPLQYSCRRAASSITAPRRGCTRPPAPSPGACSIRPASEPRPPSRMQHAAGMECNLLARMCIRASSCFPPPARHRGSPEHSSGNGNVSYSCLSLIPLNLSMYFRTRAAPVYFAGGMTTTTRQFRLRGRTEGPLRWQCCPVGAPRSRARQCLHSHTLVQPDMQPGRSQGGWGGVASEAEQARAGGRIVSAGCAERARAVGGAGVDRVRGSAAEAPGAERVCIDVRVDGF